MTMEEYKKTLETKNNGQRFSKYVTKTLLSLILVFSILILTNFNSSLKSKVKQNLFKSTFNFSYINNIYEKFTNVFNEKDIIPVFKEEDTEKIEEYKDGVKITNDKEEVSLIYSGIVTYIGESKDYGNVIIIQGSNGIDTTYGNIKTSNVKLYDYVTKGSVIGTKDNEYYVVLQKNKKYLNYYETIN